MQAKISLRLARSLKSTRTYLGVLFLAAMVSACGTNIEATYPSGDTDEMEDSGSFLDFFSFGASAKAKADGSRSEERRVGKSVDLGGRRIIKKKKRVRRGGREQE